MAKTHLEQKGQELETAQLGSQVEGREHVCAWGGRFRRLHES